MPRGSTAYVTPVGVNIATRLGADGVAFVPSQRENAEIIAANGHATSNMASHHPWVELPGPLDVRPHERERGSSGVARSAVVTSIVLSADCLASLCLLMIIHTFSVVELVYLAGVLAVLALRNSYRPRLSLRLGDDSLRIAEALVVPFAAIAVVAHVSGPSVASLVPMSLMAAVLIPASRAVAYMLIRRLRTRGVLMERTLIIGADEVGTEIARILTEHREYGLLPVGLVDAEHAADEAHIAFDPAAPQDMIRHLGVTRIIIAFSKFSDADVVDILRGCGSLPLRVHVVPRLYELGATVASSEVEDLWGFPLVAVKRSANRWSARFAKRLLDLVVGSLLLTLSAPVFGLIAAAVRLTSPGPVFFKQLRVGESGRHIEILKFRTLLCNNDSDLTWNVGHDDRRTCVGPFLRRTGLDELPQLLNVLRGDMSLVGPRPERPYFANLFATEVPGYADRQRMPQGITGWAQVHGLRGDTPIPERVRFDNYYIEHWTIWRDVQILARTVGAVLGRRGA
jgi:exopolysaccharide biosynthesis polyprenyl glycosylphosphotransferase